MKLILPIEGEEVSEWALVELQGHIEFSGESLANETVGPIFYDGQGNPTLQIGNHHLQGRKVALKNPFLVIKSSPSCPSSPSSRPSTSTTNSTSPFSRKRKASNPPPSPTTAKKEKKEEKEEKEDGQENDIPDDIDSKWKGVALIRSKFLFKNRPKPIPRNTVTID